VICSRDKHGEEVVDDETVLYFGSHNFSAAAWGKLELKGT